MFYIDELKDDIKSRTNFVPEPTSGGAAVEKRSVVLPPPNFPMEAGPHIFTVTGDDGKAYYCTWSDDGRIVPIDEWDGNYGGYLFD